MSFRILIILKQKIFYEFKSSFLCLTLFSLSFIFSSCSKETETLSELGKWTLIEKLIEDSNGDLKWVNVDEDFQQIELLEDERFIFSSHSIFNCLVGILQPKGSYDSEKNVITIENSDCGTRFFSYYLQDESYFPIYLVEKPRLSPTMPAFLTSSIKKWL